MNPRNHWMIAAALMALTGTACNPYPADEGVSPKLERIIAYNSDATTGQPPLVAEATGGPVALTGINIGAPVTAADAGYETACPAGNCWGGVAFILQFNKALDGLSVQSLPTTNPDQSVNDNACVPAAGITITPAGTYYTCYYPSNASGGAQIIFHRGTDLATAPDVPAMTGNDPINSTFAAGTTFRITGTVKDQQGNSLPIDASFTTAP